MNIMTQIAVSVRM